MALKANLVRVAKTKVQHIKNQLNPKKLIQQTLPMSVAWLTKGSKIRTFGGNSRQIQRKMFNPILCP